MRLRCSDRFAVPLPDGSRFPIAEYAMLRDGIVARGIVGADANTMREALA
ncbi:MAG: hypothetical protein ACOY71_11790 [Gemmatimonadota bacterium]